MSMKGKRPLVEGKRKGGNQYVYIGFVGIKCCGKPVYFECRGLNNDC